MNYAEWERNVPETLKADGLWQVKAYRLGKFSVDLGWFDVTKLMGDRRTLSLSDQLYKALGSICANLAEGYSYSTGKNRARMYEYALGSARESREWYYDGRHVLGEAVMLHRLQLLSEVIRLLTVMIPDQRNRDRIRPLREPRAVYTVERDTPDRPPLSAEELESLLQNAPLP